MGEKLCPVDKKECIRGRCMIFDEEQEVCNWAKSVTPPGEPVKKATHPESGKQKKKRSGALSSKYRVHLFD